VHSPDARERRASVKPWGALVDTRGRNAFGPGRPCAAEPSALVPQQAAPRTLDELPRGFRLTAREAIRIAEREPEVREERGVGAGLRRFVARPLYTGDPYYWFFFYIAWFAPLALVALLGAYGPARSSILGRRQIA
jgi:hypothetical protein